MAASRYCPSCLSAVSRSITSQSRISPIQTPSFLLPFHQVRTAVQSANAAKYKRKGKDAPASQRKKKGRTTYYTADLKNALQFSLIDAMRYAISLITSVEPDVLTCSRQVSESYRSWPSPDIIEIRTTHQTQNTQERRSCSKSITTTTPCQDRSPNLRHLSPR